MLHGFFLHSSPSFLGHPTRHFSRSHNFSNLPKAAIFKLAMVASSLLHIKIFCDPPAPAAQASEFSSHFSSTRHLFRFLLGASRTNNPLICFSPSFLLPLKTPRLWGDFLLLSLACFDGIPPPSLDLTPLAAAAKLCCHRLFFFL